MKNLAIILAGGSGKRLKGEIPKQFLKLSGKLIIEHTIEKFEKHERINEIIIVTNADYYEKTIEIIEKNSYKKVKKVLKGGRTRQESSYIGLSSSEGFDNVLIHDAVRPFVSKEIIDEILNALETYQAVDVAVPSPDTIIKINNQNFIEEIPDRKYLRRGQTPQGFRFELIKKVHELAIKDNFLNATDDCGLVLKYKVSDVFVVNGSDFNIKITYPIDIHIADKIFQVRNESIKNVDISEIKDKLKDKVVVVFGGNSGIGKEIIEYVNNNNGFAYGFSRKNNVDIRDYKSVNNSLKEVYKKHKKIDSVVVSSGILNLGFIDSISLREIIEQIDINYLGSVIVSKASIEYLKDTKGSLVLFASSSYTRGRPGYSIYSSSKAALVNFAQGFADEMVKYKIRVNVVNPERTATPMRRKAFGKEDESLLLSSKFVALHTISIMFSDFTGQIFDIRISDQRKE